MTAAPARRRRATPADRKSDREIQYIDADGSRVVHGFPGLDGTTGREGFDFLRPETGMAHETFYQLHPTPGSFCERITVVTFHGTLVTDYRGDLLATFEVRFNGRSATRFEGVRLPADGSSPSAIEFRVALRPVNGGVRIWSTLLAGDETIVRNDGDSVEADLAGATQLEVSANLGVEGPCIFWVVPEIQVVSWDATVVPVPGDPVMEAMMAVGIRPVVTRQRVTLALHDSDPVCLDGWPDAAGNTLTPCDLRIFFVDGATIIQLPFPAQALDGRDLAVMLTGTMENRSGEQAEIEVATGIGAGDAIQAITPRLDSGTRSFELVMRLTQPFLGLGPHELGLAMAFGGTPHTLRSTEHRAPVQLDPTGETHTLQVLLSPSGASLRFEGVAIGLSQATYLA